MSPKITVGMPVYNNEKFIRNAIESILSQTFEDFELIISDNASTDSTAKICHEYANIDKRIRLIRQIQNMGSIWNFNFVLQESKSEYFMWAASDDYWHPTFIKKNIEILESNRTLVGSGSDIGLYRKHTAELKPDLNDISNKNTKKFQYACPAHGTFEKRVKTYLRLFQASIIYGIYRTEKMKMSFIHSRYFWAMDLAIILNLLRHGDLNVIDEVLMYRYVQDKPSKSIIQYQLKAKIPLIEIVFCDFPFTVWCLKNLGLKIFVKNLHLFIKLNLRGEFVILGETIRIIKRITFRQEKFW